MKITIEDFNKRMGKLLYVSTNFKEKDFLYKNRKISIVKFKNDKLYSPETLLFYEKIEKLSPFTVLKYFITSFYIDWDETYSYRYKNLHLFKKFKSALPLSGFNYFIDGEWYTIIEY